MARMLTVLVAGMRDTDSDGGGVARDVLAGLDEAALGGHVRLELVGPDPGDALGAIAAHHATAVVVVGATSRDRPPGSIRRLRLRPLPDGPGNRQAAGGAPVARTGLDALVALGRREPGFPERSVIIDAEPPSRSSEGAPASLASLTALVADEVRRMPLLALGDETRAYTAGDGRLEPTAALRALWGLLDELERIDEEGGWGDVFARGRDLQYAVADGQTGEGMGCVDWAMWWGLLEELERLGGHGIGSSAVAPGPLRR